MMLDLVSRYCDLVAPIAGNWFMSASITMLLRLTYVIVGATVIRAIDKCFLALLLHMLLQLIEADLRLRAAIRAPEHGLIQDGCHDKVKVSLLSKLVVARIA